MPVCKILQIQSFGTIIAELMTYYVNMKDIYRPTT